MSEELDGTSFVLRIARATILDLTSEEIAEKLANQFVEKYGDLVVEKLTIEESELRERVLNKLSDKIIDNFARKYRDENGNI